MFTTFHSWVHGICLPQQPLFLHFIYVLRQYVYAQDKYLLRTEFESRTVRCGPSFSSSIYPPKGHRSKGTKRGSVTYSTDRDWEGEVSKIFTHLYSVSDQTVVNWRKWLGNLVKLFVVCYCLLFWELTVRQTFARQKGRCVCWYN